MSTIGLMELQRQKRNNKRTLKQHRNGKRISNEEAIHHLKKKKMIE